MGFHTFGNWWDESYDRETDHMRRLICILDLIQEIDSYSIEQLNNMYSEMIPVLQHNHAHMVKISRDGTMMPTVRDWTDNTIGLF